MNRIFFIISILIILSVSCKTTYTTGTTGVEDVAFIKITKDNNNEQEYKNAPLNLIIDGNKITLSNKIYKEKKSMKADKITIEPGKHHIIIKYGSNTLYDNTAFIDNQETRKIILR